MPRYIAFLRAINVGGRFVKMATLADHFRTLGHTEVTTFINSGNVVFRSPSRSGAALAQSLTANLEPLLGFTSEVFVRSESELHALTHHALQMGPQVGAEGEVNVIFVHRPLTPAQQALLADLSSNVDTFHCLGREAFWLCQCRQSDSRFSNAVFERKLGLSATFRRANMLERLCTQVGAKP